LSYMIIECLLREEAEPLWTELPYQRLCGVLERTSHALFCWLSFKCLEADGGLKTPSKLEQSFFTTEFSVSWRAVRSNSSSV